MLTTVVYGLQVDHSRVLTKCCARAFKSRDPDMQKVPPMRSHYMYTFTVFLRFALLQWCVNMCGEPEGRSHIFPVNQWIIH